MTTMLAQPGEDTGSILVRVQDELRHLRDQITTSGGVVDVEAFTAALTRTEKAVQGKAEELLSAQQNHVMTLPTVNTAPSVVPASVRSVASGGVGGGGGYKSRYPQGATHKTPGQVVREQWVSRMVAAPLRQPSNVTAREIIEEQFGVGKPRERLALPPISPPKPVMGPTVKGSPPLPKANRLNPRLTPPAITEKDAKRGILSLCERGLIPPAAELTLEPSPIKQRSAHIHYTGPGALERIADAQELEHTMVGVQLDSSVHEMPIGPTPKTGPRLITASVPLRGKSGASSVKMINTPFSALSPAPPPLGPPQTPALTKSRKFTIQNGRAVTENAEFDEFRREFAGQWSVIAPCLQDLEELLEKWAVPVAVVEGENLVRLALRYRMELRPSGPELVACCTNQASILATMATPGQLYRGPRGPDLAAAKIQATYRMYQERLRYLEFRERQRAATLISVKWLMVMKMTNVRTGLKMARGRYLTRHRERQIELKSSWAGIQSRPRVIIHLPSRGYSQQIRDSLVDYHNLQNRQMGRICDVNDANVEVIYISPIDLDNDMQQYYMKLLGMGVTTNGESFPGGAGRVKFLVPDHLDKFPGLNFCLSSLLLYSSQTMKRLQRLIAGKTAYIVPGIVHKDDLELSEKLNVPVIGAEPDIVNLFSTKSGAKRIFNNAGVTVPPSEFDIYSEEQLFELLSSLVASNLNIKRWVFKIDGEFDGRGTAYCDVTEFLDCHRWALKQAERYGSKWSKRWAQEPAIIKIYSELPEIIYNNLKIVNRTLFPSIDKFLVAFTKSGGVIEACPPSDDVTCITVDMFVDPAGNVEIRNTGDQIRATEFQTWAISSPQTSIAPARLHSSCIAVGKACYDRAIIGHISTTFATFMLSDCEEQLLWAIDLKIQYTDTAALANVLQYVTGGRFNTATGLFKIPEYSVLPEASSRFKSPKERQPPPYRFAVLSPRLFHSNLSLVHYSVFFQMCRAHHIGYDLREREGAIFTLIDSYRRELLGMAVVESDLVKALKTFQRNLTTVHQEISSANMPGRNNFLALASEVGRIIESLNTGLEAPPEGKEAGEAGKK